MRIGLTPPTDPDYLILLRVSLFLSRVPGDWATTLAAPAISLDYIN